MVNGTVQPVSHVQLKIISIERDLEPKGDTQRSRNPTANSVGNSISSISPTNSSHSSSNLDKTKQSSKSPTSSKSSSKKKTSVGNSSNSSSNSSSNDDYHQTPRTPEKSSSTSNSSSPTNSKSKNKKSSATATKATTASTTNRSSSSNSSSTRVTNVPNILCKVERVEDGREGSLLLYDLALEDHELLQEKKSYLFSSLYQFLEVYENKRNGSNVRSPNYSSNHSSLANPQLTFLLPYPLRTSIIKRPPQSSNRSSQHHQHHHNHHHRKSKSSKPRRAQACVAVAKDVNSPLNSQVVPEASKESLIVQQQPVIMINKNNPHQFQQFQESKSVPTTTRQFNHKTSSVEVGQQQPRSIQILTKNNSTSHHFHNTSFKSASYY